MPLTIDFGIGFWHPFGSHGGETASEILARKRREIDTNGFTLWSFQIRRCLERWHEEIESAQPDRVLVFCSNGHGSTDPKGAVKHCSHYQPIGAATIPIPDSIEVPHPIGSKAEASAFIVESVVEPITDPTLFPVQWYMPHGNRWRDDSLPTRGEYLVRQGGTSELRGYRALLVLKAPYLATVKLAA